MANIAFFGTPDFAATIFYGLVNYCKENGHTIDFAVCQPDRPKGRSQTVVEVSKVKSIAIENQIEILQPSTLKATSDDGDAFYQKIKNRNLDLAIVVAYGRIIPNRILALPAKGFINVHASLLPRWRGASPIQRAIQAGEQSTGVSIMDLVQEMDAGDVYSMSSIPIEKEDDSATLTSKLADLGLAALLNSFEKILNGEMEKFPQELSGVTFAPKLVKEDGKIPWEKSASAVINHVRAMNPWPQSYTYHGKRMIKLFDARLPNDNSLRNAASPGEIVGIEKNLLVQCADRPVAFSMIQFEGKNRMTIRDVINGKLLCLGDRFSDHPSAI